MLDTTAPNHPAPTLGLDPGLVHQLPADAYYELVRTLRLTLPPPLTGSAEDLARRDRAAIARLAALAPANAAEADLAAQVVAAAEQWKECLRLAQQPDTAPDGVPAKSIHFAGRSEWAHKCRAQANSMMRQGQSALRLLLRMQQARRKLEADETASDRAAWTEHCALGFLAEALAAQPSPAPAAQAEAEQTAAAETAACPDEAEAALVAAAERYAATYPERAARIRRTGRLPADVRYFNPPEAALAHILTTAHTPALAALDGTPPEPGAS